MTDDGPLILPADPDQPVPYTVTDAAAKDTHGSQPPVGASTLDSGVLDLTLSGGALDLLAAVFEALDVPLPGLDTADERAYQRLMELRISNVRSSLAPILNSPEAGLFDFDARGIRTRTAGAPVTYTVWQDPGAGEGQDAAPVEAPDAHTTTTPHPAARPAPMTAKEWNRLYPVGTRVVAYPDVRPEHPAAITYRKRAANGLPALGPDPCVRLETVTRTPAWTLGHAVAVVSVDGYAGGISLEYVDPAQGQ